MGLTNMEACLLVVINSKGITDLIGSLFNIDEGFGAKTIYRQVNQADDS